LSGEAPQRRTLEEDLHGKNEVKIRPQEWQWPQGNIETRWPQDVRIRTLQDRRPQSGEQARGTQNGEQAWWSTEDSAQDKQRTQNGTQDNRTTRPIPPCHRIKRAVHTHRGAQDEPFFRPARA
jgi:hypothetical protein